MQNSKVSAIDGINGRDNHDFLAYVLGEDSDMVRSLQRGMGTRAFQPGPLAGLEEAIHHVLNAYLDRMFD